MRCPECDLEMMLYSTGTAGDVYVCRNPRCGKYDHRLDPAVEVEEEAVEKAAK